MATLYVTEYGQLAQVALAGFGPSGPTQAAQEPALTNQAVAISSTSAASSAFQANTMLVRLQSDTNCWVTFATDPTATASLTPLTAGVPEYFGVPLGGTYKVAGITA
jgi:hypothetical protein